MPKTFFAFGLNYKTAPVEIREKLHLNDEEIRMFIGELQKTMSECLVLSTCNRTEVYGVSESPDIDVEFFKNRLIELKEAEGLVRDEHFFALISCSACQQLFNVATSIDSRVIGDSQILRQLRGAYFAAQESRSAGKILNQLLQRAFKLGKRTYNETCIHEGAVSVSLAAVEMAIKTFGSLQGKTVLVVGAGETARLTTEALVSRRVGKLLLTNRTRAHAETLLAELKAEYPIASEILDFETFKARLPEVDIVISSTGSEEPIFYKADLEYQTAKTLVVDIAVPRDVDEAVAEAPNVVLRNIDDLNTIIDGHQERRVADLPKVRKMIIEEMVEFLNWYYLLPLMPEYEKTGTKPSGEIAAEIMRLKEFLNQNVSEIHKFAAHSGKDFNDDLQSHYSLIERLQQIKAETFSVAAI